MKYLLAGFLISLSNFCFCQRTVEELADLSDKAFFDDVYVNSRLGKDLYKRLKKGRITVQDLPAIKEVAILSMYVRNQSYRKGRKGDATFRHDQQENKLAAGILSASLNNIRNSLDQKGTALLLPETYLNTGNKQEVYKAFQLDYSSVLESSGFFRYAEKDDTFFATPKEYEMISINFEGRTNEILDQVNTLTGQLDLRVALIIEAQIQTMNSSFIFESVTMSLLCEDPSNKQKGMIMAMAKYAPSSQVAFASWSDRKIDRSRYDGFGPILGRLTNYLIETVIEEIESVK